jgi:hypothetical protein
MKFSKTIVTVIVLALALFGLWQDFKTFREGSQSLINWGSESTNMMIGIVAFALAVAAALKGIAWVILWARKKYSTGKYSGR